MITNAGDKVNGGSERKRAEDGKSRPATYTIIYRMPQVRDSSAFGGEAGSGEKRDGVCGTRGKWHGKKNTKKGKKVLDKGDGVWYPT